MHPDLKKTLKALSLDLRHLLEGRYDTAGTWRAGDLEQRLNALGVWRDRAPLPADELPHLSEVDQQARAVVDAYLTLRREAGIELGDAVAEFVRETAYTWANRLLALRCMEARGLIDEVILQKAVYGGRSLEHHRLAQRHPELCLGEDDGLFAALEAAFARQAEHLPLLFDPRAPGVALRPSAAALKQAVIALSGAAGEAFQAADALGWAYQYWNTEEKARVFEKVRTERGAKIAGADIIPATQLYTEPYMVKFLVQNSLGALWMGMHPDSRLYEGWEYYVRDADRAPVERKLLREVTFLDPACGSGHFLLEAFDLFYAMYEEEAHGTGRPLTAAEICAAILQNNLYGIDIDERAVQIAEAALWMKAAETAFDFRSAPTNLVATNIRLPKGKDHLAAFLTQHPEDRDLRPALEVIFEGLVHADELGSLLQLEEPVEKELRYLQARMEERRGKPEQAVMFAELEKPKQGELPVGVESYEAWKARTLTRLKMHFAGEAQAADLSQAFFGRSAEKGVRLFDLLARRYDVVVANPPYMGSKNMGAMLKKYVEQNHTPGKRDLYAAFILRCIDLTLDSGCAALVTLHTFLTSRAFRELRYSLLNSAYFDTLVHLGTGTMKSLSNPNAQGFCMYVLRRTLNSSGDYVGTFLRLVDAEDKQAVFLDVLNNAQSPRIYKRNPSSFQQLKENQFIYWLQDDLLALLASRDKLGSLAKVPKGLSTGNNNRFLRFHWEVSDLHVWVAYAKGGGYRKWHGLQWYSLNWKNDGFLIRNLQNENGYIRSRVQNEQFYRCAGYTYTEVANSSFGARVLDELEFFDARSPGIFPQTSVTANLLAILNCRLSTFFFRCISPGVMLDQAYAPDIPLPSNLESPEIERLTESVCICKKFLSAAQIEERSFAGVIEPLGDDSNLVLQSCLLAIEGQLEERVFSLFTISEISREIVLNETGIPVGWFPMLSGYDVLPQTAYPLPTEVVLDIPQREQGVFSTDQLTDIKQRLRLLYEAGPGAKEEFDETNADSDSDTENALTGVYIPIPPETFLEELSQKLQIHPISVYWLLKEGIEQEGWRCLPEERRITADRFTVLILRLLGHRWPKQVEAGEPVPEWVVPDGIIPLTEGAASPTLLARVRERLAAEFPGGEPAALEREFQELMGESLEAWLGQSFFKHHTSQFKKRPIAWQLQSGRWTSRQKPAFACLIYCHKIDGDTLATLQSQYVRPLRQRYETELRGIESIPANARSARQDARRTELGDLFQELGDFDAALGRVAAEGFASPALEQLLAREPMDRWCSVDGVKAPSEDRAALLRQEQRYLPDLNDGVRVNIAPLQKAGLLAADVLAKKDLDQAIADRAEWRADERRWCREGKLPRPGWWEEGK